MACAPMPMGGWPLSTYLTALVEKDGNGAQEARRDEPEEWLVDTNVPMYYILYYVEYREVMYGYANRATG